MDAELVVAVAPIENAPLVPITLLMLLCIDRNEDDACIKIPSTYSIWTASRVYPSLYMTLAKDWYNTKYCHTRGVH